VSLKVSTLCSGVSPERRILPSEYRRHSDQMPLQGHEIPALKAIIRPGVRIIHPSAPLLLSVLLLVWFSRAHAQDTQAQGSQLQPGQARSEAATAPWRTLLGWEGGNYFSYPYAILKVPLRASLDNGLGLKLGGDGLQYQFNARGSRISATAPGAEALVGYTVSGDIGTFGLSLRPQYRHTDYDHGFVSSHHYEDVGFKTEFSGTGHISPMMHMSVSASYTTVNEMYRLQLRPLLYGAINRIQVGPEAIFLGNPDFSRKQYGLALTGIPLTHGISLTAHAGYMHHLSLASGAVTEGAYFGVSLLIPIGGGSPPKGPENEAL